MLQVKADLKGAKMPREKNLPALIVLLAAALIVQGCSLMLTDYQRPDLDEISSYPYEELYQKNRLDEDFYQSFGDKMLSDAIDKALSNNSQMQTAFLNVRSAWYSLGLSRTNILPDFNSGIGFDISRELDHGNPSVRSSSSSLGLSFEVDLFSRLEAQRLSSGENLMASLYDYLAMRLTVISSVSQAYWQYAYAKEALALGEEELKDGRRRLELVQSRYEAGSADLLELDTAKVNFLAIEDTYDARVQAVGNAANALTYLLGENAQSTVYTLKLEDAASPDIGLEIPASLLSRRPDLMAAEARLKAAFYDVDEANSSFFPTLNLTASVTGGDAASFGRILSDPIGALGAAITFPFLNYWDLKYEKELALVERDLARVDFVDTYLDAVKEVYDALENLNYYQKAVVTAEETLNLATLNRDRYEARYRYGSATLTDFLDACDTQRQAAISFLGLKRDLLDAKMTLMVALGGGTDEESVTMVLQSLENIGQS